MNGSIPSTPREQMDVNRRRWDELADLHPDTQYYASRMRLLEAGGSTLQRLEVEEVGDVSGRRLLHLQCHLGTESVSWAHRGARVTGVDYSANAMAQARAFAERAGVDVTYLESNVLDLPSVLDGAFDIVYTSWGVLGWLPDLDAWARVVHHFLAPGGTFYIAEFHPVAWMFDDTASTPVLRYAYFGDEPLVEDSGDSYALAEPALRHRVTFNWYYTLGGLVSALASAGLVIDFLHEWPRTPEPFLKMLVPDTGAPEDGWHRMPDGVPAIPLSFTLRAHRP